MKFWIIGILFSIFSLYFSMYILEKWIMKLSEFWLIFPTWIIFVLFMIGINIYIWSLLI